MTASAPGRPALAREPQTQAADGDDTAGSAERQKLGALLRRLRQAVARSHAQATADRPVGGRRRSPLLRQRWLLGLELLWKMEEQVLLPAVHDLAPEGAPAVAHASSDIELLRDLALLVRRTSAANSEAAMRILQGLAEVHFARVDSLLAGTAADDADWPHLYTEVQQLLDRWRSEIASDGDIEDEEQDPVGLPPR